MFVWDFSTYKKRFNHIQKEYATQLMEIFAEEAYYEVEEEAIKLLDNKSPGVVRTRYNPKRKVVAARAGFPPNTDTGNLRNSFIPVVSRKKDTVDMRILSGAHYAGHLEFGTSKMGARPFMARAIKKKKKVLQQYLVKAFKNTTKKARGIN